MIDYWTSFQDFCDQEIASGGPDPQVKLTAAATKHLPMTQAQRFVGCFIGPYTCGAAGPLWHFYDDRPATYTAFIAEHWDGLPHRRERRAIDKRSGEKLAECIWSWDAWCQRDLPMLQQEPYETLYSSVLRNVTFMGRYAAMKALETLYQQGFIAHAQDSICAAGAKYPRATLGQLWPEHAAVITAPNDSPTTLAVCDYVSAMTKERVGVETWYDFETLLCNYRQALAGKYPGRSHDRELAHFLKAHNYWGDQILGWFDFYNLRKKLFPPQYLGELGSPPWWGAREELEVPFAA